MINFQNYKTVPIGSLVTVDDAVADSYYKRLPNLPASVTDIVLSWKTGAFIRGLTRTYDLPMTTAPAIALTVLRIAFGERKLAELPVLLSSATGIAQDKAGLLAKEIEKELFAPVMLDLNAFLSSLKQRPAQSTGGATNVLNLKTAPKPISGMNRTAALPVPPTLPRPPRAIM